MVPEAFNAARMFGTMFQINLVIRQRSFIFYKRFNTTDIGQSLIKDVRRKCGRSVSQQLRYIYLEVKTLENDLGFVGVLGFGIGINIIFG